MYESKIERNPTDELDRLVVSFSDFPTMPAPFLGEGDGEAWDCGDYLCILTKNPPMIRDVIERLGAGGDVGTVPPAEKYGIRYLYAWTVFYKAGHCSMKVNTQRPACVMTVEQVNPFLVYGHGPDVWSEPVTCGFEPLKRWNSESPCGLLRNLDFARKSFFDFMVPKSYGKPIRIGTMLDAKRLYLTDVPIRIHPAETARRVVDQVVEYSLDLMQFVSRDKCLRYLSDDATEHQVYFAAVLYLPVSFIPGLSTELQTDAFRLFSEFAMSKFDENFDNRSCVIKNVRDRAISTPTEELAKMIDAASLKFDTEGFCKAALLTAAENVIRHLFGEVPVDDYSPLRKRMLVYALRMQLYARQHIQDMGL